jgi:phage-related minor tail protein
MMAVSVGDLVVFLRGDDSQLDSTLNNAQTKTQSFGGIATSVLGGAVVAGAAAAAGAIAAVGIAAFDVSRDTEVATATIAAQLGIPIGAAQAFGDVARDVFANNFASSVQDAGAAVALLAQQLGLTAEDPALQTMTENAFRLRDTFGVDVSESIDAVKTLMDNFGITGDEAFDLIAAGFQSGLDRSGDFLDTIGEYSTQFSNGGATAGQFFSLLDSGLQGGVLGTDKAADAFKEFQVRIADGSTTTADGLALLGLNIDDITTGLSDGTLTTADAFNIVQEALRGTDDSVVRFQAGVALLGTQYEDLGDNAATALNMNNEWAAGTEQSIESLDAIYNTFGDAVSGVWRRLTVSISPFTDKLLELVNSAMPQVMAAFDAFDQNIGPTMENAQRVIDNVVSFIMNLFSSASESTNNDLLGPLQYWQQWVDTNLPMIQTLFENILGAIQQFWAIFGDDIIRIVGNTFDIVVTVIDTVMRTIGDIVTLALQLLTGDWEGAGQTLENIVQRLWDTIVTIFSNQLDSIRTLFGVIDWQAAGQAIVDGVRDGINNAWDSLIDWFNGKLQELRNMLPFSEPRDSSSPLRGLGKAGQATVEMYQDGMDQAFAGLNASMSGGLAGMVGAPMLAAAGNSSTNITINITGSDDAQTIGRAAENGVLSALRRAGVR